VVVLAVGTARIQMVYVVKGTNRCEQTMAVEWRNSLWNLPFYNFQLVTCRNPEDLPYIRACMETEIDSIRKAGLLPTPEHLEMFSSTLESSGLGGESNDLHHVLLCFNELASVEGDYFLGRGTTMFEIAKLIAHVNLPLRDKFNLCLCPVSLHSQRSLDALLRFAGALERGKSLRVGRHCVNPTTAETFNDLTHLCANVDEIDLLLWLQTRFTAFAPVDEWELKLSYEVKEMTIEYINEALLNSDQLELDHCYVTSDERRRNGFRNKNGGGKLNMFVPPSSLNLMGDSSSSGARQYVHRKVAIV
jgi:hypothetical protein